MREESVVVSDSDGGCVVTVLHVRGDEVTLLVSHSSIEKPGVLNTWTAKLVRDASFKVGNTAEVMLVDVRGEKVRLGINASRSASVHRLSGGDAEDGPSGSRVPRPGGPKPPSLDVRLDEPPPADGW